MKTLFNLPKKIVFCNSCVLSNQFPTSYPEYQHTFDRKGAKYLNINTSGVCDACHYAKKKDDLIDWKKRERELLKLLEKKRGNGIDYDCIVAGSGGKDSVYASHLLKYKYDMNPLTITWPPILYTDYGKDNFLRWIKKGGFDNITINYNPEVLRRLTKLSLQKLLHPFQTFVMGQKHAVPKIANKFNIDLVFYGDPDGEWGNPIVENSTSLRKKSYYATQATNIYLAGIKVKELISKYKFSKKDLSLYLPTKIKDIKKNFQVHHLGYYIKWIPQEAYYYSVEHTGFKARPERTQGSFSKYSSIDDKIDDLHYFTTYIKYGHGRCSYDASQEIRNNHITLKEAKALIKKYDGEYPDKYLMDVLNYLEIKKDEFDKLCNKFRSPHLWAKKGNKFFLRHNVNKEGYDD